MPITIKDREAEALPAEIKALSRRYSARLPAHPASPDEIVGYDERGMPS